ncbi:MAG: redoxin domain-containing protein [Gammaproteobacteria bacterium]|nr:redoxin domain-containing protein [Gammaproteobacteria bacterium]
MKNRLVLLFTVVILSLLQQAGAEGGMQCPEFLNHEFKRLHSSETINLCSIYNGKPLLIVNTASHCGFTKQFKGLEALYQKYKDRGLQIIGFSSDDFNQEAKSEEEAASICYKNFGVTFTMLAQTSVKGDSANPVFVYLADKSEKPGWNFNKYLVSDNGLSVEHFGAMRKPLGGELENRIVKVLEERK